MARLRLAGWVLGFAGLVLAAGPASAGGGRHPLFDDQGTLTWYTNLDEAQAAARATGKLIIIESGRLRCPNCKSFVENVLTSPYVRRRIESIAIGLAIDCDTNSDMRVENLLNSGIPDPTMLPLVGVVTPELRWVTGWSGYMDASMFGGHVTLCEERFERIKQYRRRVAATPAPAPAPTPAPAPAPVSPPVCSTPTPTPRPIVPTPPVAPRPTPVAPAAPPVAVTPKPVPPTKTLPLAEKPAVPAPGCDHLGDACPGGVCLVPLSRPKAPAQPSTDALRLPDTSAVARGATPGAPTESTPKGAPAPIVPPGAAQVSPAPATPTPPVAPAPSATTKSPAIADRAAPAPVPAPAPAPADPMTTARAAAADGRWGDVLRVADASPRLTAAERGELDALVRRANEWAVEKLDATIALASDKQFADARRTLTLVSTQLSGTTNPNLIDAERGRRAVDALSAIEQGSPDRADAPEQLRKKAYSEFRGSRWASMFKASAPGR